MSAGGLRRSGCGASCHVVMLSALALALSAQAAPRIAVPPEGIALGEIAVGTNVSGTVELRNVGKVAVNVSRVKACCGAAAELSPMAIPPNGVATLKVSLKVQDVGPFSKTIRISCDDPEQPIVSVPVTGTVGNASGNEVGNVRDGIYSIFFLGFGMFLSVATLLDFLLLRNRETTLRRGLRTCLVYTVRIGIGGTFVFAGCVKMVDVEAFAELVARYGMLPSVLVGPFAHALPVAEVVAGAMLVATRWTRLAAITIAFMLMAFIVALVQAVIQGLDVSCGCFGGLAGGSRMELVLAVARDVLLLVPLLWLVLRSVKSNIRFLQP